MKYLVIGGANYSLLFKNLMAKIRSKGIFVLALVFYRDVDLERDQQWKSTTNLNLNENMEIEWNHFIHRLQHRGCYMNNAKEALLWLSNVDNG